MRKTLLATSALALAGAVAVGSASAADKMSVGLSGYMQQWVGVSDLDNNAAGNGGVSQYSDSEFYVTGSLEADNGLTFAVRIELEGNTHPDVIDESNASVSGSFGRVILGSEDHTASSMHLAVQDVGVGLACGDPSFINGLTSCARSGAKGLGTSGWLIGGDSQKIVYFTPRMSGVQLGLAYSPESVEDSGAGSPVNNDNDAWSMGLNYQGEMGDTSVGISLGHYQESQVGASEMLMSGMNDDAMTRGAVTANQAIIDRYNAETGLAKYKKEKTVMSGTTQAAAATATNLLAAATDVTASKADDQTFTNFGIRVGMGSFGFSAAVAAHDGGSYMVANSDIVQIVDGHTWDHDGDADTAAVAETADNNDPSNDTARTVLVKNTAADYEVASAGVMYSDGPMAVSLSHMMADADDGSSVSATMLSGSYTLAPGIASRTTLMAGEQDGMKGTAFVTGITLSF